MPTRIRKDVFLQSLALPRAVHNPCQRREMTVSTNNGLVNGPVHNLLMQFFTLLVHFSAIFVMLAVLATSVTPCYPPRGV